MTRFYAAWNMPGYLPEMEVEEFDAFDEAKRFLIEELLVVADYSTEDDAETLTHAAEDMNLWGDSAAEFHESAVMPDGFVYWIHREMAQEVAS